MFKPEKNNNIDKVSLTLDGKQIFLPAATSVAAGLLGINEPVSKISSTSGKPCSPYCLMGVCFECTMEIDGIKRQACLTEVEEGMEINRGLKGAEEKGK
ncbi:MAG: (2Fe-2S)-binding protein [Desulfobacteraceae bacterium]|nr:(2Fe-2S)-binding protein [Desulfobacteraceae bacterium]